MKQLITKKNQPILLFLFTFLLLTNLDAQNIALEQDGACINCLNSDPSAVLEIRATDRGLLIPRVANTSTITNPAEGLMIYDNSVNAFQYYDGTAWYNTEILKHISFTDVADLFIGFGSGVSNTMSGGNTAVGTNSLYNNTTGTSNTAVGYSALAGNLTGYENIAHGRLALSANSTGHNNTAVGLIALGANDTGFENTACGNYALSHNTTGSFNTAHGYQALYNGETGFLNTAIGYSAFFNGVDYNNSTAVGYLAQPTGSNQVRLGNNSITQIGGFTNWSNVSDARFKTQIQNNVPGLAFISLLNPVTYQMDMDAIAKHQHTPDSLRLAESERAKAAIRYTGFLAQEVEKAAELVDYDFSGVDAPQHERDNYSLRYAEFVVPLVKAVQELEAENKALRAHNADLEARLGKIEALLRQRAE